MLLKFCRGGAKPVYDALQKSKKDEVLAMQVSMSRKIFGTLALMASLTPVLAAQGGPLVIGPDQVQKVFPPSVFYRGQTAPSQLRNSGGVQFPNGFFVLASLVDTSGYSTAVAAKYQGYLITEVPIRIEGQSLAPGAYGFGFVDGGKFVVTDIGGHDVFLVNSFEDTGMARPRPLQVTTDPQEGFRLYAGRRYIRFHRQAS